MSWEEQILKAQQAADSGNFALAEEHLGAARTMAEDLAANDKRRFLVQEMLADLMQRQGRIDEAEQCWLKSLEVRLTRYGPIHHRYAQGLLKIASFYFENERFEKAEKYGRDVLKIQEKLYGPTSEEVGQICGQLADTMYELHRFEEAEHMFRRAIGIRRHTVGTSDTQAVYLTQRYAALLEQTGRPDEAAHFRASAQGRISGILKGFNQKDELV